LKNFKDDMNGGSAIGISGVIESWHSRNNTSRNRLITLRKR